MTWLWDEQGRNRKGEEFPLVEDPDYSRWPASDECKRCQMVLPLNKAGYCCRSCELGYANKELE